MGPDCHRLGEYPSFIKLSQSHLEVCNESTTHPKAPFSVLSNINAVSGHSSFDGADTKKGRLSNANEMVYLQNDKGRRVSLRRVAL